MTQLNMDDDDDKWLERFEFLQPLGGGGMGEVYLAEDKSRANELCVIKKIVTEQKDLLTQAEMIRMGQREAEFLRKLNHRGIVKFLDEHSSLDGLYVVMEYVPGHNLEELVNKEGSLDSETVIRIGIQCCDVLEYLHSANPPIIYRDLKPSNLMLRPDGLVVFIDFGIARDFEPKDGPVTRVVTSGYSPPEQYFGKPEPRGDLYSLGATMHHLLTGLRPKPLTVCSPSQLNRSVLLELDSLVKHLTAHDKEERPPSARAVQYELFSMYKKIHPEFEIPDLELAEDDSDRQTRRDKPEKRKTANEKLKNAGSNSHSHEESDDTESGGNLPLISKLWQWLENLTGKRSN